MLKFKFAVPTRHRNLMYFKKNRIHKEKNKVIKMNDLNYKTDNQTINIQESKMLNVCPLGVHEVYSVVNASSMLELGNTSNLTSTIRSP